MAWQKTRIALPEGLSPSQREQVANDVLDFIILRAAGGVGHDGKRNKTFPGYTKEYAEEKGQTNVDLVLTSEMLDSMRLLSHNAQSILIGFDNKTEQNDKAEGNAIGSYGRSPNPSKARPFLGLRQSDLKEIIREVKASG